MLEHVHNTVAETLDSEIDEELKFYFRDLPPTYMRELMYEDLIHYTRKFQPIILAKRNIDKEFYAKKFDCFLKLLGGSSLKELGKEFDRTPFTIAHWARGIYRQIINISKLRDGFDFFAKYKHAVSPLAKSNAEKRVRNEQRRERVRREREARFWEEEDRKKRERIHKIFNDPRRIFQSKIMMRQYWAVTGKHEPGQMEKIDAEIAALKVRIAEEFEC